MNYLIKLCDRLRILRSDIDYHVYLLKQDLLRLSLQYRETSPSTATLTEMPTAEDALRRVV